MAKDSVKGKKDDWHIPVWTDAEKRFYRRLNQAAKSTGLTRIEVLEHGIELVVEEWNRKKRPSLKKLSDDDIETMRASLSHFAKQRWQNTPVKERKRIGKMLAEARRARRAERTKNE
jgi:acyl-CoA reductase-like NAD-dependent aldehyde dehydrogenase